MNCNFTLYGPVHSGKSTLAGLIITWDKDLKELGRMDQRIMEELGDEYDPTQRFAYYVDTANDERKRNKHVSSIGTSKHLHYQRVRLGEQADILLIDSPGSTKHWKQNYRSSFLADIGVLIYDVSSFRKLANMEKNSSAFKHEKEKLMRHIEIWKKYKNLRHLIIAISKMDSDKGAHHSTDGYSRILYANAITVIKGEPELQDIPIVPIAIDIHNRIEHNIYTKSSMMSWYNGKTLMEIIQEKIDYFRSNEVSEPYTFASLVEKLRIKETKEPVFRIKVLSGEIKKGETLMITQVAESKTADFKVGEAMIKSLKQDKGERTNIFVKGMVGGATLSRIKLNGKSVSAETLQLSRVSYLVGSGIKVQIGNILCFMCTNDIEEFYGLNMHDKVNLLMFGKIISTFLVGKYCHENGFYLYVYTKSYPLAMPVSKNGDMLLPNYVIEKENMEFLSVKLIKLNMINDNNPCFLKVEFDQESLNTEAINDILLGLPLKKREKNVWYFKLKTDDIEFVSSRLRYQFRRYHIVDFSAKIINNLIE